MLTQARETLHELDETHRRWADDRERVARRAREAEAEARLTAAAARVWGRFAPTVPASPGHRMAVRLDAEAAGIPRTDAVDVLRRLAAAAQADVDFWRRTGATGLDFEVEVAPAPPVAPPPAEAVEPVPIGPARIGRPRPGRAYW